jgi:hypothetical protein
VFWYPDAATPVESVMTPILTETPGVLAVLDELEPLAGVELPAPADVLAGVLLASVDFFDELHAVSASRAAHTSAHGARYLLRGMAKLGRGIQTSGMGDGRRANASRRRVPSIR